MTTLNQMTDDVMVSLGFDHDDSRSRIAVMFNVKLAVDKLRDQVISKSMRSGDTRAYQDMIHVYSVDISTAFDPLTDYRYFTLPAEVYSLPNDRGLNFIRYQQGHFPTNCPNDIGKRTFTITSLAAVHTLYGSQYQRPSSMNPYAARYTGSDGTERVAIIGVDPLVKKIRVGLLAALPDFADIDPDEDVDLPPEFCYNAKRMVMALEGWLFQIPQERRKNDGRDFNVGQPPFRVSPPLSINDPELTDI